LKIEKSTIIVIPWVLNSPVSIPILHAMSLESRFGWIDTDEDTRRRMLDLIDPFRTRDTVDELGLGPLREAFADYLFPGTSTIQTRARYFLFIPWVYDSVGYRVDVAEKARRSEDQIIESLKAGGCGEGDGVIGYDAGRKLKRPASNIYWNGLWRWGIRRRRGNQDQFHRYLASRSERPSHRSSEELEESTLADIDKDWAAHLPVAPKDFPHEPLTFDLQPDEAGFLRDRICTSNPGSLLAVMVRARDFMDSDRPWDNPAAVSISGELRDHLDAARCLAEAMEGASLFYNLLLSREIKDENLSGEYEEAIKDWHDRFDARKAALEKWAAGFETFWRLHALVEAHIPNLTKAFVQGWAGIVLSGKENIASNRKAETLIRERESRVKGIRARLFNAHYRSMWNKESGTGHLDYRWKQVKRILRDIHAGLGNTDA